ncbi:MULTISPECIES: integrase [Pseudomonas]|nr:MULTISPECIES: integrase [Pseudomonas]SEP47516.1 Phage integrase family protein [Pseudomonas sp. Snoq117.2]
MGTKQWEAIELQPSDLREIPENQRDAMIITATKIYDQWVVLSIYEHDRWQLDGIPSNARTSERHIDFLKAPIIFRPIMKQIMYRYLRRGREKQKRPRGMAVKRLFSNIVQFLNYIDNLQITSLGKITNLVYANYIHECKESHIPKRKKNKPLSPATLVKRFTAVEALYELSQYTTDPIPQPPWPETSPSAMVGLAGKKIAQPYACVTPLLPDSVFCTLFEKAYEKLLDGSRLLDIRDAFDNYITENRLVNSWPKSKAKNRFLVSLGWKDGLAALRKSLIDLRTSCYIVIASTSGCRNHELADIRLGAHQYTEDEDGLIYHWLRSNSSKTETGIHDWMIPEVAVHAIKLMERWAVPYQALISAEINHRTDSNPLDPAIAQAINHKSALFLGVSTRKKNEARVLSHTSWDDKLEKFCKAAGLDWTLNSHQFRRKFANYVAHSQFGDLRYLREHFAHWSMDMTLGYAMDDEWGQQFDLELYDDIQSELTDIKVRTVSDWISEDSLAGGYGQSLKRWQRDPANLALFKDHRTMVLTIAESTSIRSNGHAWCTADNDACIGNTLERTRCGDCNNAVIGRAHLKIYSHMYRSLNELLKCDDIGEGGRSRVMRDLERCRDVLLQLGFDAEDN